MSLIRRWINTLSSSCQGSSRAILRGWLVAFVAMACVGCSNSDMAVAADVDPSLWRLPVRLSFENSDTQQPCRLTLFARLADSFEADTLTVRIETLSPDSTRYREYHRMLLSAERTAAPLRRIALVPYRRKVVFPQKGCYHIEIQPTRRIAGIEAVGLQITNE